MKHMVWQEHGPHIQRQHVVVGVLALKLIIIACACMQADLMKIMKSWHWCTW